MTFELRKKAEGIFGEKALKPFKKEVPPSQKISEILKIKSTNKILEVEKSTIETLANFLILIRKLEEKSILTAEKYIAGLLEFSKMYNLFDYISYIIRHDKEPILEMPVY